MKNGTDDAHGGGGDDALLNSCMQEHRTSDPTFRFGLHAYAERMPANSSEVSAS